MPPVAALAAAVGTAAAGAAAAVTVGGLATGLAVAGTAVSLIGKAVGSKTMGKVGMGMSIAGGVVGVGGLATGTLSNSVMGAGNTSSIGTNGLGKMSSGSVGIANSSSNIPSAINSNKSILAAPTAAQVGKDSAMNTVTNAMGGEVSSAQRIQDVLTRYDRTANLLGGMAQGYWQQQQTDVIKDRDKYDRKVTERAYNNLNGTPAVINMQPKNLMQLAK